MQPVAAVLALSLATTPGDAASGIEMSPGTSAGPVAPTAAEVPPSTPPITAPLSGPTEGPAPPIVPPSRLRDARGSDPRLDPAWVKRDRALLGGTIGLAAVTGLAAISIPLTFKYLDSGRSECSEPTGCNDFRPITGRGLIVTAEVVVLIGCLAGLVGFGTALTAHREPLRRWRLVATAGGLQIQF